jgi:hypothetical protein
MNVSGTHLENRVAVPRRRNFSAPPPHVLDVLNNSNQSGAPGAEFASHSLTTTAFAGAVVAATFAAFASASSIATHHPRARSSNHSPAARTTPQSIRFVFASYRNTLSPLFFNPNPA